MCASRWRLRRQPGGEAIGKRAPYVDVVFGLQTLHKLPEMLEASQSGETVVDISFPN